MTASGFQFGHYRGMVDISQDYGVEGDGKQVTINLGMVPSFSLPNASAIKLALLILKKAGVEVDITSYNRGH